MKLVEVTVLVAVPDEVVTEEVRNQIGESVGQGLNVDQTILDVSVTSEREAVSEEEVQEMVAC